MSNKSPDDFLLPYEWPGSYYMGEEELANVTKVLRGRSPFRFYGHDVQHFAQRLEYAYRQRLGRSHALAVSSGTAALSIAMGSLGLGPGDEILLPGYFWVSCVAAVVRAGAVPRLVEVNDTFVMDPQDMERKITPHTKAVLIVHMSGATGDLDELIRIARKHDLRVIEDVAQANGGTFHGKPLGSFGDVAIFSFQLNKNITAGEGGLLACDDETLYHRAVALHDLGYARDADGRLVMDDPSMQMWGHGARMSEIAAAVLTAQEKKLDTIVEAMRSTNHRLYRGIAEVAGVRGRRVPDPDGDCGSFVLLIWPSREVCLDMVKRTRERGVVTGPKGINNIPLTGWGLHLYYNNRSLTEKRGIAASGFPWTAPENSFSRDYTYERGTLPTTDDLFDRASLIAVPPTLSADSCDRVIDIYGQCAAEIGSAAPVS